MGVFLGARYPCTRCLARSPANKLTGPPLHALSRQTWLHQWAERRFCRERKEAGCGGERDVIRFLLKDEKNVIWFLLKEERDVIGFLAVF